MLALTPPAVSPADVTTAWSVAAGLTIGGLAVALIVLWAAFHTAAVARARTQPLPKTTEEMLEEVRALAAGALEADRPQTTYEATRIGVLLDAIDEALKIEARA